jgi:hypothetical protein
MDLTLLITIGEEVAKEIIDAIHNKNGTVQSVGTTLDADRAMIDADIAQLKAEQTPPTP